VKQRSPQFNKSDAYVHLVGLVDTVKVFWPHLPQDERGVPITNPWENEVCLSHLQEAPWLDVFCDNYGQSMLL